ncbi:MAG TPA: sugar ABC transporter permease [Phycisphaerales bacterium]|nr:sugar ABC transporter permease [Phycisphaerales bacterium]
MRESRRNLLAGLLWVSPWLVGVAAFLLAPLAITAYVSFTDYSLLEEPVWVGAANYREMAGDPVFWKAVRNTGLYALSFLVLGTVVSVLIAVLLEQPLRGRGLVRAIVFLPTLIPVVSASIGWMWLFNAQHGLLNAVLGRVGLPTPDWLGNPTFAMPSLILMSLWVVGSYVVICTAALRDVPAALYEAADLDGMGALARFRHVTLPMISPAILFNAVMSIIWGLQVFAVPLIMTKGGPNNATVVFSMYVYSNAFAYGRMGYASALAWVQLLATLALTGVALMIARRFVHYRGA